MRCYTRDDATAHYIVPALGEYADQYDVEQIANEVLTMRHRANATGQIVGDPWYDLNVSDDEFWACVARHELPTQEAAR